MNTSIQCADICLDRACSRVVVQLISTAHWPTDVSCSLAKWHQLHIGQVMSAAHLSTVLLIGQLMSAAHWPSEVSCSLANWNQQLFGQHMSAAHWPSDVSCSLAKWCQVLTVLLMSAAHWPIEISSSLANCAAQWQTDFSCSFAKWCQLVICQVMSMLIYQLTSRIKDLRISISDLVDFWSCYLYVSNHHLIPCSDVTMFPLDQVGCEHCIKE